MHCNKGRFWPRGDETMKAPQTLYLIASEHDFRLVHNHDDSLVQLGGKSSEDFPDVAYRFPSERTRSHTGHMGASFDVNGPAKKVEQERSRLAHHAAAALEVEWAKGVYDRIVLVAGPKMLGDLRHFMSKPMATHVAAELHKDLMKTPLHELPSHFAEVAGV
jgi:protein required for attachment to host cells